MRTNEELAILAKQGDREAMALLWEQVKRFIFQRLSRYYQLGIARGYEPEDLQQEGYFALVVAVKYYDPDKGYAFITYISNCVNIAVYAALDTKGHMKNKKKLQPMPVSLDMQIAGDREPIRLVDALEDVGAARDMEQVENDLYTAQLREALRPGLDALDQRGREVLHGRYFKGETCAQIGQRYGVTRQTVHDKEKKSLRKFQTPDYLQCLKPFLYP